MDKWLSRSFFVVLVAIVGAFVLAWHLKEAMAATVIVPAALTGWFGGKAAAGFAGKRNGAGGA